MNKGSAFIILVLLLALLLTFSSCAGNPSGDVDSNGGKDSNSTVSDGKVNGDGTQKTEDGVTSENNGDGASDSTDTLDTEATKKLLTYEEYIALDPQGQYEYCIEFETLESFILWYNDAKAVYDAEHGAEDIGGGSIDIGDIFGND